MEKEPVYVTVPGTVVFGEWKVRGGSSVRQNDVIATVQVSEGDSGSGGKKVVDVKAPREGTIRMKSGVKPGMPITSRFHLADVEHCAHTVVYNSLCSICGATVTKAAADPEGYVAPVHRVPGIQVSTQEFSRVESDLKQMLLKSRKLILVLDLDHTLLHATSEAAAEDMWAAANKPPRPDTDTDLTKPTNGESSTLLTTVRTYLASTDPDLDIHDLLVTAASQGQVDAVQEMISDKRCHPDHNANEALLAAAEGDHKAVVELLLTVYNVAYENLAPAINAASKLPTPDVHQVLIAAHRVQIEGYPGKPIAEGVAQALYNRAFYRIDVGAGGFIYIKLRPGVFEFLQRAGDLCQCHIFTMGTAAYAKKIASILDTDRSIFGTRIYSRDDAAELNSKNLGQVCLYDDTMILIVDDREDVWRGIPNLLHVAQFRHFAGMSDMNNLAQDRRRGGAGNGNAGGGGETLQNSAYQVTGMDDQVLPAIMGIISDCHERFFAKVQQAADAGDTMASTVKIQDILLARMREVLSGVKLVLSGVIPTNAPRHSPKLNILRYAERLGAEILNTVDDDVTYLVAARDGTEKVTRARALGIPVLKASWLWHCIGNWRRYEQNVYLLDPRQEQSAVFKKRPLPAAISDDDRKRPRHAAPLPPPSPRQNPNNPHAYPPASPRLPPRSPAIRQRSLSIDSVQSDGSQSDLIAMLEAELASAGEEDEEGSDS